MASSHVRPDVGLGTNPSDIELQNTITLPGSTTTEALASDTASTSHLLQHHKMPKEPVALVQRHETSGSKSRLDWASFWIYEIGAIIINIAFMVAIIVVLSHVDGKPLSSWTLPLSPNTLIAIFATLSISAILLVYSMY